MKENAKPSIYFSAYPLKAIGTNESKEKKTSSPYLRAILSAKPELRPAARTRVFPMINAYKDPYGETLNPISGGITPINRVLNRMPADMEK